MIPSSAVRGADVGSGAGLPGLVLAIVTGTPFLLIESDKRKAAFLQEAARLTHAPARVVAQRVETVIAAVDLVTARAFANVATLLRAAAGLICPDTTVVLLKGTRPDAELVEAAGAWSMVVERHPSATREGGNVLVIRDIRPRVAPTGSRQRAGG